MGSWRKSSTVELMDRVARPPRHAVATLPLPAVQMGQQTSDGPACLRWPRFAKGGRFIDARGGSAQAPSGAAMALFERLFSPSG